MGAERDFGKLDDTNYQTWKYRMEMLLVKMDLWDVVSGEDNRPIGSENTKSVKAYRKKQQAARAEIALRVADNQLIFTKQEDPAEIWSKLEKVHTARGFATRKTLRRRFHNMTRREDQSMQSWVAEVQGAAQELRELGAVFDEETEGIVLTGGLGPAYEPLMVSLDAGDGQELDYTITRLLNEAKRQEEDKQPDRTSVMHAEARKSRKDLKDVTCYQCGKKGHYKNHCPELENKKEEINLSYAF
jgi:hypothetical protein